MQLYIIEYNLINMKFLSCLLVHSLLIFASSDITTQTISWISSKETNLATGVTSTDPEKLVVYQKERIEWFDAKGTKKNTLTIQSTKGNLSIDGQGEVIYQVTAEKIRGNITIKKTATQTIIKVVLVEDNKPSIHELLISSYTVL